MNTTNPKIQLAKDTIDSADFEALREWLKDEPRLTMGPLCSEFERQWADKMNSQYAVFVNSGSSGILLALYSLICGGYFKNDKIVLPALCWATDLAPVIQFNLTPILCDCNLSDLSVDIDHLEYIFENEKPSALILVSVLGLVPYMERIVFLCEQYNVLLIEDICESLYSSYKNKLLGTFGKVAINSLYFGHHTSTVEGGIITTNDKLLYDTMVMCRSHGWARNLDEEKKKELQTEWDVSDFESLYKFYEPGFNVRSTDLQAFIGLRQLDKLDSFVKARYRIYMMYNQLIQNNYWKPKDYPDRYVSLLGYPVISPHREKIVQELIANGVECRPLIAGSMGNQPFWINRYGRVSLPNADLVDKYGLYVPCHPFLKDEDIELIASIVNKHTPLNS